MAANPQMVIRVAASVAELKKNLAEGKANIEALSASVEKYAKDWTKHSATIQHNAHNIVAAIKQVGASTLTAGDASRALKTLDGAMAQLRIAGQPIPPLMAATAAELRALHPAATAGASALGSLKNIAGQLGLVFGAGALVMGVRSFVKDLFAMGDSLTKMSSKSGIAIEDLQVLSTVAMRGGTDLESVVSAINMMQKRIAGGDDSAVRALQFLKLNFDTLRAMAPDQQFYAIAKAVEAVGDVALRSKLRVDLFGKSGNEMADAMAQSMEQARADTVVMSTGMAVALDTAGEKLQLWFTNAKKWTAGVVVEFFSKAAHLGDIAVRAAYTVAQKMAEVFAKLFEWGATASRLTGQFGAANDFSAVGKTATDNAAFYRDAANSITAAMDRESLAALKAAAAATTHNAAIDDYGGKAKEAAWNANKMADAYDNELAFLNDLMNAEIRAGAVWVQQQQNRVRATELANAIIEASTFSVYEQNERLWERMDAGLDAWSRAFTAKTAATFSGNVVVASMASFAERFKSIASALAPVFANINTTLGQVMQTATGTLEVFFDKAGTAAEQSARKIVAAFAGAASIISQLFGGSKVAGVASGALGGAATGAGIGFMFGGAAGAGLGALIGGVAGLAGGLVGLFSSASAAGKKVNDLRDAFIASSGGLAALNAKAHDAGMTLDALLKANKVEAYTAAEQALTAAIEQQNAVLANQVALQKSISETQSQLDAARSASVPGWQTISGLMEKYGIDIEKAGSAAQQMMVSAGATSFLNEAQQWKAAGLDPNIFAQASSGALSTLLQQAKEFGSVMPENMRSLIEASASAGKLLDKAGKPIDISMIIYGPAIQTEQEKLIAEFDRLTLALQDLTTQLAILTGHPPVVVGATRAGGGLYESGGVTGRGGSYIGLGAAQDARGGGGGGGTVNVNLTVQANDVGSFREWLRSGPAKEISDAIVPYFPGSVQFRVGT
jgi:hypothetical protein